MASGLFSGFEIIKLKFLEEFNDHILDDCHFKSRSGSRNIIQVKN